MNTSDFELKKALDTYFNSQFKLQVQIIRNLESIEKQQRALLAIFAASAKEFSK